MSHCPFCHPDPAPTSAAPNPGAGKRTTGIFRRTWHGLQWLFPAALLVLTPKCPMCIVAYVALFTGLGISVSAARGIQILMPVSALALLALLAVRFWRRRSKARGFSASASS